MLKRYTVNANLTGDLSVCSFNARFVLELVDRQIEQIEEHYNSLRDYYRLEGEFLYNGDCFENSNTYHCALNFYKAPGLCCLSAPRLRDIFLADLEILGQRHHISDVEFVYKTLLK